MTLSRRVRKSVLVLHVTVSAVWLGLSLGLLAMALTALSTDDRAVTGAAFIAMGVFGEWLMVPVALLSLLSGLLLSLGTPWGLVRHRWVLTKFVLVLITTGLTLFVLRPGLIAGAEAALAGPVTPTGDMVIPPIVSTSTYLFVTAVSVLKPWGRTRWGRRDRHGAAAARSARTPAAVS